jgi:hypothetical protein
MRAIHEYDCDFSIIGICTCGAVNKCRRMGGCPDQPGHDANLKKFKALLESEKSAATASAALAAERVQTDAAPSAGGTTNAGV